MALADTLRQNCTLQQLIASSLVKTRTGAYRVYLGGNALSFYWSILSHHNRGPDFESRSMCVSFEVYVFGPFCFGALFL